MEPILNLKDYTILQHVCFVLGCLLWVFTYLITIHSIRRKKFIEIPLIAVTANFAWEILWSFVFRTDMGLLYVWGYRIWFFLDCFIVWGLFQYGHKQILLDGLQKISKQIIVFGIAAWLLVLYYYIKHYDYPVSHNGVYSGYILNVMMSALYIPLMLRLRTALPFKVNAAWFKGLGSFFITLFCFLRYRDGFLLSMCAVTTLLDAWYIYLIYKKPQQV